MKILRNLLVILAAAAAATPARAGLDFTLRSRHEGPQAAEPENRFISDGENHIYLHIPRKWTTMSSGEQLVLLPGKASCEAQITQVRGVQALPLDPTGLAALRKAAQETLPQGAKDIKLAGETNDLLPLFGWKSYETKFEYDFFGQAMSRSVLYINMIPGRVVRVSVTAPVTDFDKVHEQVRELMFGWFEPNRDLSPAAAREYEEGGYHGS